MSADGYILTNRHVVADATEVTVKLIDRREFPAKVIGMDETTDVAVLKIEGNNLPTVRIGDPEKLKPGQWVVAIGSPFGMENSVTAGIVSATSRRIDGEQFVPFIQTDVAVNPAIPVGRYSISTAKSWASTHRSTAAAAATWDCRSRFRSTWRTTCASNSSAPARSRVAASVCRSSRMNAESAESFGLDRPHGALVADVTAGEAADKAGIKPGDIILSVGGKPVASEVMLPSMVAAIKPGTSTEFEVWRDGKSRTLTVKVGENKEAGARTALVPGRGGNRGGEEASASEAVLGMSVRPLSAQEKQQTRTSGALVVESVGGPAGKAGIRQGDIILGVGSANVSTLAELRTAVARATGRYVAVRVQRREGVQFVQILRE